MVKNRQNARDDSQIGRREAIISSAGLSGPFIPEDYWHRSRERGSASILALLRLGLFSCVLLAVLPLLGVGFAAETVAPQVSISSPEDGFVTSQGTLEVTVDFKASANSRGDKSTGNVNAVILKMNDEEVGHYNYPSRSKEGSHVFEVDISSLSDGPVTLQAFAYQGNSRAPNEGKSESISVTIDRTAPEIKGILTPEPNENGWNNSDVTVSFEATDEHSGIAEVSPDVEVTEEGAGQTFTGIATDNAGNTTETTVTVNLDKTGPDVEAEVTPDANAEGWHREDPTVSFKATDELSGIDEVSPETKVSSEGKDQVIEGTAVDKAGNSTSASEKVSLDKSPPEISNLRPEEGASLDDLRPTISADFSDNLSGVDTDTARLALDGKAVEGSVSVSPEGMSFRPETDLSEGEHTVEVNVSDLASNAAEEKKTTFTVDAGGPPGGTNLTVLPSTLRVKDIGTTAPLTVYLEKDGQLTDVSKDPSTTYESSDPTTVSVDDSGSMTFLGEGTAEVTASYGELKAVSQIEVDADSAALIEGSVGPAGGDVILPNGTGVSIPEGSLTEKQTIRIEEDTELPDGALPEEDGALVGPAYEFTPDGLTFEKPIEIFMKYDPGIIPPSYDEGDTFVFWLRPDDNQWVLQTAPPTNPEDPEAEGTQQAIDTDRDLVEARTTHFTNFATGTAPPLPMPTPERINDRRNPDFGTELNMIHYPQRHNTAAPIAEYRNTNHNTDDIRYILLHSTVSAYNQRLASMVYWERNNEDDGLFATYYVGRDGNIVQMFGDEYKANHACVGGKGCPESTNARKEIDNTHSIGIELVNASDAEPGGRVESYTGRQMSALTRLVDFLIKRYQLNPQPIVRPTGWNGSNYDKGNVITHAEQRGVTPKGCYKYDPAGPFRSNSLCSHPGAMQGSPSLEEIVYQAVSADHKGAITTKGGDAFGVAEAGRGGKVDLHFGDPTLENDADNARDTLVVPAGDVVDFAGPNNLMHLIVNGRLNITDDTNLDVDGVFYVGPEGKIDASGMARSPDGLDGHSLNIKADGFALIEGLIDTSGADTEAPFPGVPPHEKGGSGGSFTFRTAAPGPVWVPTIITRGGDADESLPLLPDFNPLLPDDGTDPGLMSGGSGGNVTIKAVNNNAEDRVSMHFQGRDDFQGSGTFPADRLPVPPPFNQMPIVTANAADPPSQAACQRPTAGQRLPLGRQSADIAGANISAFKRGILTVGGIGGGHDDRNIRGAIGGDGGSITVDNETRGRMLFRDVDFFTGAGVEQLCYQITIPNGGIVKRYMAPSGGLGAKGALNGGHGGAGGKGGNICIESVIDHPGGASTAPVYGHNGSDPNSSPSYSRTEIGQTLIFADSINGGNTLLETNSTGGSGGAPGGGASGRSGSFGAKGADGITQVLQGTNLCP